MLTFDGFNKAIKYVLSPSPNQHALANHALSPEVSIAGDSPPNQHPIIFCHSEQARTQGTILILPRSPETCSTSFIQTACNHVVAWMPSHCQVRAFHFAKLPGVSFREVPAGISSRKAPFWAYHCEELTVLAGLVSPIADSSQGEKSETEQECASRPNGTNMTTIKPGASKFKPLAAQRRQNKILRHRAVEASWFHNLL